MNETEFCNLYSQYHGEKLTNIKQLKCDVYNGEELKKLIEYFIKATKEDKE